LTFNPTTRRIVILEKAMQARSEGDDPALHGLELGVEIENLFVDFVGKRIEPFDDTVEDDRKSSEPRRQTSELFFEPMPVVGFAKGRHDTQLDIGAGSDGLLGRVLETE